MRRADLQRRGLSHLLDPTRSFTEADVARAAAELEGSLDPTALQEALDALSGAAAPPLDPLVRFAESRADSGLRSQALELLERYRQDPRVTDLLQRLATRDPDESIRDDASRMLRVGNR
jgi:hypothetical protein